MSDLWTTHELTSDDFTLVCLPGIGGRLWDIVYKGQSLLFQNPDLVGTIPDLSNLHALPTKSPQFNIPLWGGEKTWIAPDSLWHEQAPYPELDSGSYDVISCNPEQITMRSNVCSLSGLQIEREITLRTPSTWTIDHKITNRGPSPRIAGIWSVMMLDRPAHIGMTIDANETKYEIVFGDPEDCVSSKGRFLLHDCNKPVEFKTGADASSSKVIIRLGSGLSGTYLACSTSAPMAKDKFAHGHNFEVFNSKDYDYCEAEWHSPKQSLAAGSSMEFRQEFCIWSGNDLPAYIDLSKSEQELLICMS